ncbi:MAG: HAMP domain-containing sensor histidine kinase [Clostridia bacterium]|nr:HAMP domain-containing sensor histidine kinase [Clostridia bacterium]
MLFLLFSSGLFSAMAVNLLVGILSLFWGIERVYALMPFHFIAILVINIALLYRNVNKLILRRLRELNSAMEQVAGGNYDVSVPVTGCDELSGLTESFNRMTAELKANAFLSRDFVRYISHEFKTPLAVIRNYAEITQDDAGSEETLRNMDVIISEADRLTALSRNVLELCRLDSTTLIEKNDRFSPAAQIRSVILDLQTLWGEKQIDMNPELDEFEIVSNEALLFRVWQNIIGNAIKFTGQGGSIAVSLKKEGGTLICKVADDGIGISKEDQPHLFTPFYSGNRFRNQEGSGLGLSLSLKIVEKLGGTIAFESEVQKGTVFTVTLPV